MRRRCRRRRAFERACSSEGRPPTQFVSKQRPAFSVSRLALAASVTLAIGASLYAFALRGEVVALRESVATTAAEATRLRGELTKLRGSWVEVTRAMDVLKAPDMLKVDLKGQGNMPGAAGRAFWSRTAGLIFTADRLPALPPGRVYQLWTITGTVATGAGTFTPDAQGAASVTSIVAPGAALPDAFGVTIEPAGGSTTPTMPIVMVGAK
jgi:hypothetical protein